MADGPDPTAPPPGGRRPERPLPLPARLLGAGVRGAQTVAGATGVDRAVEVATEEAIVAAVESEAVERALSRVLQGPAVEQAVQGALQSEALKQALIEALDSELVDEVWRRLLASDEAQQLVERIAEAPEVRAAVAAQGVGLISDIGRQVARFAHRVDGTVERIARRIVFRTPRTEPSANAGLVSRALAIGIDLVIVNLSFSAVAAIVALIASAFSGNADGASDQALVLGAGCLADAGRPLPADLLDPDGPDPGNALPPDQARLPREAADAPRPGDETADRPRALGRHPRDRLPRDPLQRAPPRLGGPDQRLRGALHRADRQPRPVVDPGAGRQRSRRRGPRPRPGASRARPRRPAPG